MILVDTPVWIDHLRSPDTLLKSLLEGRLILAHPFVVGEVGMGRFKRRDEILQRLQRLPQAVIAANEEVLRLVTDNNLFGRGIGYVDAHLLTAVMLTPEALLWTRDLRLAEMAQSLGVNFSQTQ